MEKDFDETILDNKAEFKKRFKKIDRKDIPIVAINKSLEKITDISQLAKKTDAEN